VRCNLQVIPTLCFQKMIGETSGKSVKLIGAISTGIGIILLYGLLGSVENDCYYVWQLLGQYRYCEEEYVGEKRTINYLVLFYVLIVLGAGIIVYRIGTKVVRFYENSDNEKSQT